MYLGKMPPRITEDPDLYWQIRTQINLIEFTRRES